jgi:hypothetical protein
LGSIAFFLDCAMCHLESVMNSSHGGSIFVEQCTTANNCAALRDKVAARAEGYGR